MSGLSGGYIKWDESLTDFAVLKATKSLALSEIRQSASDGFSYSSGEND